MLMDRTYYIEEIEETIQDAKDDGIKSKQQAFYLLGKISLLYDQGIIADDDYKRLYALFQKEFDFTTEDYDSIVT
ncbi:MAG TPA: hypothetical protein PKY46_00990 [Ignavibacteriaceae bacterium]|jgi:Ser-tRNA(Ala) deacylase AlaX|nr:hypothetical protein [Ignavibacteriaceae bacterium]